MLPHVCSVRSPAGRQGAQHPLQQPSDNCSPDTADHPGLRPTPGSGPSSLPRTRIAPFSEDLPCRFAVFHPRLWEFRNSYGVHFEFRLPHRVTEAKSIVFRLTATANRWGPLGRHCRSWATTTAAWRGGKPLGGLMIVLYSRRFAMTCVNDRLASMTPRSRPSRTSTLRAGRC